MAALWSSGAERGLGGAGPAVSEHKITKVIRQAGRALGWAEQTWKDIMNLLQIPDLHGQWEVFQLSGDRRKSHHRRSAQLLNLNEKQTKAVSEIYNPRRFGARVNQHGLLEGSAFDLVLGHDLLKPEVRREVRDHINGTKPGLTIVSPPCTLFSIMQNMNKHHLGKPEKQADYIRRQHEARTPPQLRG